MVEKVQRIGLWNRDALLIHTSIVSKNNDLNLFVSLLVSLDIKISKSREQQARRDNQVLAFGRKETFLLLFTNY